MIIESKYQLLVVRTRYLKNTLELTKEIFQQAMSVFLENLAGVESTTTTPPKEEEEQEAQKVEIPQPPPDPPPEEDEIIEAKKEEKDENLKQVFKKIASKVHPDKLQNEAEDEKEYKASLFEKARISLDENDYCGIVDIAEELGIEPPPPTKKQIQLMKKMNRNLEAEINRIEETLVWVWYHEEEEKERQALMERYIKHAKKNNIRT